MPDKLAPIVVETGQVEIIPADPRLLQGALAGALAAAQSSFPPIPRDKEVTVVSKRTGSSYKFKYTPLDAILNAVRKPLADNGLAIAQTFDDGDLITTLLHKDGGAISGRLTLPDTGDDVQALGSAITYLRRYSIQAILGIATEEDDDGNRAAGNDATFAGQTPASVNKVERERLAASKPVTNGDGSLIGTVEIAKDSPEFLPHVGPDGPVLTFKLVSPDGGIKVIATGALAEVLPTVKNDIIGKRVSCWGRVRDETFTPQGSKKKVTYQVLDLERIKTPEWTLPGPLEPDDAPPLEELLNEPPDNVVLFGETV